jgi:hypothetical protein
MSGPRGSNGMGELPGRAELDAAVPQVAATMRRYLAQIGCVLRPGSVGGADLALRCFAAFLAQVAPAVTSTAQVTRGHIGDYKPWLAARPGQNKPRLTPATIICRLGTLRMFFIRIDEWGWGEAPPKVPMFTGDLPRQDQPTRNPGLGCLCADLYIADEPAGNQRASRVYGPAEQGHACRADGKLKVSAALAGRRIEPPSKTERVVLRRQVELPLLRPVRAAVPYRDQHIYAGVTAIFQQQADLTGWPDCHGWFRDSTDAWPYDERASAPGVVVRPRCPPR